MTTTTVSTTQVPLSAPLYGASFGQAVSRFFTKYATFSGRASRSEYWWWALANVIITSVLYGVMMTLIFSGATTSETGAMVPGPLFGLGVALYGIWALVVLVPGLALVWRRLHDTNRSGGFFFLAFIPFVGSIILLVFMLLESNPAGARFDRA
ncbi:DUF805 domain-containing protein [Agromyces sp. SYSU K20354]|uniref:DUF805 domain-containing protein n=1 Tax=Agromyces cavernae TaxID=2898659 RepID=UPI001E5039B2|nr:DUF805 domain-containing protein [Agromyces cavernae]MCD2440782.1 DUF805 domain-containing protein [Agromyces cavernae]